MGGPQTNPQWGTLWSKVACPLNVNKKTKDSMKTKKDWGTVPGIKGDLGDMKSKCSIYDPEREK